MAASKPHPGALHAKGYLLAGILTVIPLWITWWVFQFILSQLSRFGTPGVRALARLVQPVAPGVAELLLQPWFQFLLAVVVTLLALYALGWVATHVIGRRLIEGFDAFMNRIPLVAGIYGATKRLVAVLQQEPEAVQRVVLIPFPTPQMRALGFVTRTYREAGSGRQLAAVYVPTTPNPTSGYVEIVPLEECVPTDWSVDEAMTFIITAGSIGPEQVPFQRPPAAPPREPASRE